MHRKEYSGEEAVDKLIELIKVNGDYKDRYKKGKVWKMQYDGQMK